MATPNSNKITINNTNIILENLESNSNICLQNIFTQIRITNAIGRIKYETISITYNNGNKIIGAPLGTNITIYPSISLINANIILLINITNPMKTNLGIDVPETIEPGTSLNKLSKVKTNIKLYTK